MRRDRSRVRGCCFWHIRSCQPMRKSWMAEFEAKHPREVRKLFDPISLGTELVGIPAQSSGWFGFACAELGYTFRGVIFRGPSLLLATEITISISLFGSENRVYPQIECLQHFKSSNRPYAKWKFPQWWGYPPCIGILQIAHWKAPNRQRLRSPSFCSPWRPWACCGSQGLRCLAGQVTWDGGLDWGIWWEILI